MSCDAFSRCAPHGAVLTLFWAILLWRVPHEQFLTKAVPQQIPAGLDISRKFVLAWRFWHFKEHFFFDNFFILWYIIRLIDCNLIIIACNCLTTCYLLLIIGNLAIFNSLIISKGVPQTAKISKLEQISSKSPSQLGFAGEQLLWGTARGVLF